MRLFIRRIPVIGLIVGIAASLLGRLIDWLFPDPREMRRRDVRQQYFSARTDRESERGETGVLFFEGLRGGVWVNEVPDREAMPFPSYRELKRSSTLASARPSPGTGSCWRNPTRRGSSR